MSTRQRYDEEFKRTLVDLYHNGKTQASLIKEFGVSETALTKWIKQYSTVETDYGEILTVKQVKELQKRIHGTLKQRLDAVYKLRNQHDIKTLCRVLKINRSTYYKHFYSEPSPRTNENQTICKHILQIYNDYDNSL